MRAVLVSKEKMTDEDGDLWDSVVWAVPSDQRHPEGFRYRLAFVPRGRGRPAVLYDNHHPKGHHKHIGGEQSVCLFSGLQRLQEDFEADVALWKLSGRRFG